MLKTFTSKHGKQTDKQTEASPDNRQSTPQAKPVKEGERDAIVLLWVGFVFFKTGAHYVALTVPNLLITCEAQDKDTKAAPPCSDSRQGCSCDQTWKAQPGSPNYVLCPPRAHSAALQVQKNSHQASYNKSHSPAACRTGLGTTVQETQGS